MKRTLIILISLSATIVCILQACNKGPMPSHPATISYPVVTLVGSPVVTINNGTPWVDSGATWKDTVTGQSGTIKGYTINTSIDSVYELVYTATNENGFSTTAIRPLAVTNMSSALNISGPYINNLGAPLTITQISRAMFEVSNIDLAGEAGLIAIKSDSGLTVASMQTQETGATLTAIYYGATISYAGVSPLTMSYTDSVIKGPAPYQVELQYAITPVLRKPHP